MLNKFANKVGSGFRKVGVLVGFAVGLAAGVVGQAHAAAGDVDLTPLTGQFKAEQIVIAVLAVAGTLMTVYVAKKAVVMVLGMVRGG